MVKSCTAGSLREALILRKDPGLVPYCGGTDLMIENAISGATETSIGANESAGYLFLHKVPEMKGITEDDEHIRFGAACTFTEVIKSPLTPGILREACMGVAAPAIRNFGSIGGNIANGSPKADSALVFMVSDSKLILASADRERVLPIKDFYPGGKKLALEPDELIVGVLTPKNGLDNYYYKKVGARKALAISRCSFAGILDVKDGLIVNCATAFGAVSDVIIRMDSLDKMLIGKTIEEAGTLRETYLSAYREAIVPIRGRVSAEYRKDVCMNLLRDFLASNWI